MIQLHRLEGFYRVAKAGGYTRAARSFPYPITQPAVHQQVRKLEDELGVRLFERIAKDSVAPTSAGRQLLEFCAPFFENLPDVVAKIARREFGGVLRIEAAAMEIEHVLPHWIAALRKQRPDIQVQLREVPDGDPTRLLRGDVDLVVDVFTELPEGVMAKPALCYQTFVVAPAAMTKRKALLSFADLQDESFISFDSKLPQHLLQMLALEKEGDRPVPTLSAPSTSAILSFVEAGLGYSLIPWPQGAGPRRRGIRAQVWKPGEAEFQVSVAWRVREPQDPLVEAALAVLP